MTRCFDKKACTPEPEQLVDDRSKKSLNFVAGLLFRSRENAGAEEVGGSVPAHYHVSWLYKLAAHVTRTDAQQEDSQL